MTTLGLPEPPRLTLPIRTPRLILRDFRIEDYDAVHAYGSDAEVTRYMDWGPNTPDDTRGAIDRAMAAAAARPRIEYGLAMADARDDHVVGSIALHPRDLANLTMETGYCLHRNLWGRGLVAEAARALIGAGFGELGLHRVYATCDARNLGSWRVMEKLGMRREGRLVQDRRIRGEWRDTFVYAVLSHEWRDARSG